MRKKWIYFLILTFFSFTQFGCDTSRDETNQVKDRVAARRPIGAAAREILSAQHFQTLEVEIQYMVGFEPTEELVGSIKTFLEEVTNKPGGVNIFLSAIAPLNQGSYTIQDIRKIEDENRNAYNAGRTFGLYILFLDGYSAEDRGTNFTFGLVHRSSSVAMFGRRVREQAAQSGVSRALLENTVTRHEIGHLMGLVNVGSEMQEHHEDPNHGGHCDNSGCLMYWAVETSNLLNVLGGQVPPLDENCRNDLRANGGR
jgi:predicted Zn-dependent protease